MTTILYTSSRHNDALLGMARVAAAGRVQEARMLEEARREAERAEAKVWAAGCMKELRAAGAVRVGFKIIDAMSKYRLMRTMEDAEATLAAHMFDDMEAWGLDANNEYVWTMW